LAILQPAAPPVAGGRGLLRQRPLVNLFPIRKRDSGVRTRKGNTGQTRLGDGFLHGVAW